MKAKKWLVFGMVLLLFLLMFSAVPTVSADDGNGGPVENFEAYFRALPSDSSTWGKYTRLSFTTTDTKFPMVAANEDYDSDYLVVVFADNIEGQYDWYFTESSDGGLTWSTPAIAVDPDFEIMVGEIYSAAIDMGGDGIVHMSFARAKQSGTTQPTGIYYAQYDGTDWSTPITIQESLSPGTLYLYTNDIVVGKNDDIIHLVYGSDYPGNDNGDTWYSRSTNGGDTWSTPVNINQDDGMDVGYRPSLAADSNGNVYKTNDGGWPDYMWFCRSPNDGVSWNKHLQIGNPSLHEHRQPITMCDEEGGVYIVYMDNEASLDLMYKYSTNYGTSWTPSQTGGYTIKSTVTGMGFSYLAGFDDSGYIHIVHGSTVTGTMEAYYMKIDTSGTVIVPSEIITPDDGNPSYPTGLDVKNGNVYVTIKEYYVPPPTSKELKEGAIADLEAAKTGEKCIDKKIDCIIKHIKKSLNENLWVDDTHLNPRRGFKVFCQELVAVAMMKKTAKCKDIDFSSVIEKLIKADEILAQVAINDAEDSEVKCEKYEKKVDWWITKANKHMTRAEDAFEEGHFIRVISNYRLAWKFAQFAMRLANKDCRRRCDCNGC